MSFTDLISTPQHLLQTLSTTVSEAGQRWQSITTVNGSWQSVSEAE
jgi:hypothetical protein